MVALRRLSTSYGISASRLLDCPEGLLHEDATIRSMKRRGSDSLKKRLIFVKSNFKVCVSLGGYGYKVKELSLIHI